MTHTTYPRGGGLTRRVDRLKYFKQIKEHWKGPFSIAIFVRMREVGAVDKWIRANSNVTNLRLLLYVVPSNLHYPATDYSLWFDRTSMRKITEGWFLYPINFLRNIAIMNVVTTHYINLDMDLWPSCALQKYPLFSRLHLSASPRNPARAAGSLEERVHPAGVSAHGELSESDSAQRKPRMYSGSMIIKNIGLKYICSTKEELRRCVRRHHCTYANPTQNRHVFRHSRN